MTGQLIPFKKQATKYDWTAAWLFYCSAPEVTLAHVQKQYGMSDSALRKRASKEKWVARKSEMLAQVGANAEAQAMRTLTERHERTIKVAEKLRDVILDPSASIAVKDAVSALPAYSKLEQLFGGGATENLRAMPMINPDLLSLEELEELARLLEKGRGEAA